MQVTGTVLYYKRELWITIMTALIAIITQSRSNVVDTYHNHGFAKDNLAYIGNLHDII